MVPPGRLYTKDSVLAGRAAGLPLTERINQDAATAASGGELAEEPRVEVQSFGADVQQMRSNISKQQPTAILLPPSFVPQRHRCALQWSKDPVSNTGCLRRPVWHRSLNIGGTGWQLATCASLDLCQEQANYDPGAICGPLWLLICPTGLKEMIIVVNNNNIIKSTSSLWLGSCK